MTTVVIGSTKETLTGLWSSTWPTPTEDDCAAIGEQARSAAARA